MVDDRTEGVDIAGDAWRSGTAEPARRTGCRKPDLLVAGRVEGGLAGPGMVKSFQLQSDGIISEDSATLG